MKRLILFLIPLSFIILFCGNEDQDKWAPSIYIENIPVTGIVFEDEISEITLFSKALYELGYHISKQSIIFIRSPDQEIPQICKSTGACSSDCIDRWIDLPSIIRVAPTNPNEGFRGYCGKEHIFISRLPSVYNPEALRSLLVHEYVHSFGFSHMDSMKLTEESIQNKMSEIEKNRNKNI